MTLGIPDNLGAILSGRAGVRAGGGVARRLRPRGLLRWNALLDQAPRSQQTRALDHTSCLIISSWDFKTLLENILGHDQTPRGAQSPPARGGRADGSLTWQRKRAGSICLESIEKQPDPDHLLVRGATQAEVTPGTSSSHGRDVDIVSIDGRVSRRIKVKADPYFGTRSTRSATVGSSFYRADEGCLAFEAVANSSTRELGWTLASEAEELYYYYLALGQTQDEVRALLSEPDEVFFSENDGGA